MKIKWSKKAEFTYDDIIKYLKGNWTDREIEKFDYKIIDVIDIIKHNPHSAPILEGHLNIRKAKISKQTSLIYLIEEDKKIITLLLFWSNYQNPETLEEILSSC